MSYTPCHHPLNAQQQPQRRSKVWTSKRRAMQLEERAVHSPQFKQLAASSNFVNAPSREYPIHARLHLSSSSLVFWPNLTTAAYILSSPFLPGTIENAKCLVKRLDQGISWFPRKERDIEEITHWILSSHSWPSLLSSLLSLFSQLHYSSLTLSTELLPLV